METEDDHNSEPLRFQTLGFAAQRVVRRLRMQEPEIEAATPADGKVILYGTRSVPSGKMDVCNGGETLAKKGNAESEQDAEQKAVGARIRTARERAGISPATLAKALGISPAAVNEIQQGRSVKQYVQLRVLARTLGVTPNAILGVDDDPPALTMRAIEALLVEAGWPEARAKEAIGVAMQAAMTAPVAGLDAARSAQVAAAIEWRKRVGRK